MNSLEKRNLPRWQAVGRTALRVSSTERGTRLREVETAQVSVKTRLASIQCISIRCPGWEIATTPLVSIYTMLRSAGPASARTVRRQLAASAKKQRNFSNSTSRKAEITLEGQCCLICTASKMLQDKLCRSAQDWSNWLRSATVKRLFPLA